MTTLLALVACDCKRQYILCQGTARAPRENETGFKSECSLQSYIKYWCLGPLELSHFFLCLFDVVYCFIRAWSFSGRLKTLQMHAQTNGVSINQQRCRTKLIVSRHRAPVVNADHVPWSRAVTSYTQTLHKRQRSETTNDNSGCGERCCAVC